MSFKYNYDDQRYEELKNLKDYLHYHIAHKEYKSKIIVATLSFEDFRRNHVESKFEKLEMMGKVETRGNELKLVPMIPYLQEMASKQLQYWSIRPQ